MKLNSRIGRIYDTRRECQCGDSRRARQRYETDCVLSDFVNTLPALGLARYVTESWVTLT